MGILSSFDEWKIYEENVEGSGRGRKEWLRNPITDEIGLFKYPKEHTYKPGNILTGEHWAENIATFLADEIGIPCAKTKIGVYKGDIGVMSYLVHDNTTESLQEAVQYITKIYPNFDVDRLYDRESDKRYSIQMIEECIKETNLFQDFIKIPIFDCLIGNSDRHQSNWGIITDRSGNPIKISPLYDNGSSLCCRVKEEDITSYFKDHNRFNALINSSSMSAIAWRNERKTRQFDLLRQIRDNYFDDTIGIVKQIFYKLSDDVIHRILSNIPNSVMSLDYKKLVALFLQVRRDKIIKIYSLN